MSIATAIQNAQQKVENAYTAVSNKGGTIPATQNLSNLPAAISSIPSSGGIPREVSQTGVYQKPSSNYTFSLPSNAADLGDYSLYSAFELSTYLTSLDLSNLTTISGMSALNSVCASCTGLTTVDLSNLTTISGNSALAGAFVGCSNLSSIDLSSLSTISSTAGAFSNAFQSTAIQSLSFPSLTYIENEYEFGDMLSGVTGCTVHFPSNLQSVMENWTDVLAGFSGTNTTILFDLTATE
jgi:hypothetical protein